MPSAPRRRPSEPWSRIRITLGRSRTAGSPDTGDRHRRATDSGTRWPGGSFAALTRRLKLGLRGSLECLVGRTLFRMGRHRAARDRFERVLSLRGDHFVAHVHLGRIAYKLGDYAGWREHCAHARRTAPERFARLRHPFELFEPRTGWSLDTTRGQEISDQACRPIAARLLGPSGPPPHDAAVESSAGAAAIEPERLPALPPDAEPVDRSAELAPEPDEVLNHGERRRFRQLGPISPIELRTVDLDDLARRLSDGTD